MEYPREFVRAVKETFPRDKILHNALKEGSETVGQLLGNGEAPTINAAHVAKMIDRGNINRLRAEAAKLLLRKKLYGQWWDMSYNNPDHHPMAG